MRRVGVALLLIVAVAGLTGCHWPGQDPFDPRVIQAQNQSGVPLTFGVDENGDFRRTPQRDPLAPGQTLILFSAETDDRFIDDGCTTFDVVALGPDGSEVARAAPPLCYDDEQPAWIVGAPEDGSSP